jgi:hypothetical protein
VNLTFLQDLSHPVKKRLVIKGIAPQLSWMRRRRCGVWDTMVVMSQRGAGAAAHGAYVDAMAIMDSLWRRVVVMMTLLLDHCLDGLKKVLPLLVLLCWLLAYLRNKTQRRNGL